MLDLFLILIFGGLIIWGYWYEEKVIEFERLLFLAVKKYFKGRFKK
jgi:hypothetical protein